MRLLLRYQLKEIFLPLAAWVAFLFFLLFILYFLRGTTVLMGSAARSRDVGLLALYLGPQFLLTCLPIAILVAIQFGLGRLSEDQELKALQAFGVEPLQLLVAPLLLGVLVSTLMAGLSFRAMPWGLSEVKVLVQDIIRRNVASDMKPGIFYEDLAGLTLYVEHIDRARKWQHVLLYDSSEPDAPNLILARDGKISSPSGQSWLTLSLGEGQLHRVSGARPDSYTLLDFAQANMAVALDRSAMRKKARWGDALDDQSPEQILRAAREVEQKGGDAGALRAAFHGRLAQVFTPLAFAILGTALAMGRRGSGRARGFVSIVAAYVIFFVLARVSEQLGARGFLPLGLAGELANLVFAAVGFAMLWRMRRHGWGA